MVSLVFSHIALACKDPVALERYYTKHFGFQRARVVPLGEEDIVFIKCGDMCLELFRAREEAPMPVATGDGPWYPGVRHFAFQVDDVNAKIAAMGDDARSRITQGPMRFDEFIPGWKTVWLSDPEGNIVEISQGYADEEKPPPLKESSA